MQRQREDLALVQAAGSTELPRLMADLRVRAQADASGWKRVTEQLNLLHS